MKNVTDANFHPQDALDELLGNDQGISNEALALMLQVLQHLKVGDGDADRAETSFHHLLFHAVGAYGVLLQRLLDEPRTRYLPERTLRLTECLRLLYGGNVSEAMDFLPELRQPGASQLQRLIASRLLLRDERTVDALSQLAPHGNDIRREFSGSDQMAISRFLLNRARDSLVAVDKRRALALCAAVRNEEPYLEEWVAFHHLMGVEQFYIYENESTDETLLLLRRLADRFPIEIVQWKQQPAHLTAYENCISRFGATTEWLACIDADEFLVPTQDANLIDVLREAPDDAAAILVNWRIFGSAGHVNKPTGLTLENYTCRAPDEYDPNRHVKSIVKPARCFMPISPHHFLVSGRQFDTSFNETMPLAGRVSPPSSSRLTLHHYIVRSQEDYRRKRARGRPDPTDIRNHESTYFQEYDRNEIVDRSALKYLDSLEAILEKGY